MKEQDSFSVRTAFDTFAASYHNGFRLNLLATYARRRVWAASDGLCTSGDLVADLGCGAGADVVRFARRGVHVLAVDISPAMVMEAKTRRWKDKLCTGKTEFICLDLNQANLADYLGHRLLDGVVLSFGVINFISKPLNLFRQISDVLRPGGFILVGTYNRWCLIDLLFSVVGWRSIPTRWRRQPSNYAICGVATRAWARSEAEIIRALPADLILTDSFAVGSIAPPAYADSILRKRAVVRKILWRLDRTLERTALARLLSDFVWIQARKRG